MHKKQSVTSSSLSCSEENMKIWLFAYFQNWFSDCLLVSTRDTWWRFLSLQSTKFFVLFFKCLKFKLMSSPWALSTAFESKRGAETLCALHWERVYMHFTTYRLQSCAALSLLLNVSWVLFYWCGNGAFVLSRLIKIEGLKHCHFTFWSQIV